MHIGREACNSTRPEHDRDFVENWQMLHIIKETLTRFSRELGERKSP